MEKDQALRSIEECKTQMGLITRCETSDPVFAKWRRDTSIVLGRVFGQDSRHVKEFESIDWSPSFFVIGSGADSSFRNAFVRAHQAAQALLESMITEIERYWVSTSDGSAEVRTTPVVIQICKRFDAVAQQLRERSKGRPTLDVKDEYDAQDLCHALLRLFFQDIRREEWTPSYAGRASRADFLLKQQETIIEIKKTRKGLGGKEIGDQLSVDIMHYKAHPACKKLVCLVHDPDGLIQNPSGLELDLSRVHDGLDVEVVVTPNNK